MEVLTKVAMIVSVSICLMYLGMGYAFAKTFQSLVDDKYQGRIHIGPFFYAFAMVSWPLWFYRRSHPSIVYLNYLRLKNRVAVRGRA